MRAVLERPAKRPGGVLVRGLLGRLGARGEPMPLVQAIAIVLGAAARVHAAHARGTRAIPAPETVLVRFDGAVVIGGVRVIGGDPHGDIDALAQLLGDLVDGNRVPAELAAVIEGDFATVAELARALAAAAKALGLAPTRVDLGQWARRQIHPQRLAHTLRRDDVPELGVDLGRAKPRPSEPPPEPEPELANGSGKFDLDEVELDVELEVDLDGLVDDTGVWIGATAVDVGDAVDVAVAAADPAAGRGPLLVAIFALVVIAAVAAFVLLQPL